MTTASLYVHIPFCLGEPGAGKCDYCDFYSVSINVKDNNELLNSYVDALLCDIEDQLAVFNIDHVPTVYIGGGTPSALGAERIEKLLGGIRQLCKPMIHAPSEITIEANPESAGKAFLQACIAEGVSRLSLGVQTFHEPSRQAVHRPGNMALLEERLSLASDFFPGGLSADLITGLPFQAAEILSADIERLLAFKPAHISLYSLTIEPETPLGRSALFLPSADEADLLWITGRNLLEEAGYAQYEVSNFALQNRACAHNMRYWRMENWLGAGPSASGTIIDDSAGKGRRFTYPPNIAGYIAAPRPRIKYADVEELDRKDLIRESLLMGFRCRSGPDLNLFRKRYNICIDDCIPKTIDHWRNKGFFETPGSLSPSPEGLLFLNQFLSDAFGELDGSL